MAARRPAPSTVMEWVHRQMADSGRQLDIEALMGEMRIEQDLIALREARQLSQRQLAGRAGVKQPMIARIESGRVKNLELRTLVRLAAALGARVRVEITRDPKWDKVVPWARRRSAARA